MDPGSCAAQREGGGTSKPAALARDRMFSQRLDGSLEGGLQTAFNFLKMAWIFSGCGSRARDPVAVLFRFHAL
jgi:hypothetical protein